MRDATCMPGALQMTVRGQERQDAHSAMHSCQQFRQAFLKFPKLIKSHRFVLKNNTVQYQKISFKQNLIFFYTCLVLSKNQTLIHYNIIQYAFFLNYPRTKHIYNIYNIHFVYIYALQDIYRSLGIKTEKYEKYKKFTTK